MMSILFRSLIHFTFVFALAFFIYFLLISHISPGHLRTYPAGPASDRFKPSDHGAARYPPPLVLRSLESPTFTIAVLSDLHYGEEESGWGIEQDVKSGRAVGAILDHEGSRVPSGRSPGTRSETGATESDLDLVVLNGDLITGDNVFRENGTHYLDQVVAPLLERRLRWASVYGNHDSKFNLSRVALLERERGEPFAGWSFTRNMMDPSGEHDESGVTNFYLLVRAPAAGLSGGAREPRHGGGHDDGSDNTSSAAGPVVLILWFLDSRGGGLYQNRTNSPVEGGRPPSPSDDIRDSIPDFVSPATARWFSSTHAQLLAVHGSHVPSLLFVHIPPHVFWTAQGNGKGVPDHERQPGLDEDRPVEFQGVGAGSGSDGTGRVETGAGKKRFQDQEFVDALRGATGLRAVFVGHDHGNAWCTNWPEDDDMNEVKRDGYGRNGDGDGVVGGRYTETSGRHGNGNGSTRRPGEPFLCFVKHTGYGGYGNWKKGARMVKLRFDETMLGSRGSGGWNAVGKTGAGVDLETWIRLEDGRIVNRVSLNETYGIDVYPTDAGE